MRTRWLTRKSLAARALALPFLLTLPLSCPAGPQEPQPFHISVNVDLVLLHAAVRDRTGRFVSDLGERDFEVYEEGVRQTIRLFRHEDVPVTVGLVIDHSGSMHSKLADVIAAARTFARASNPEDEMFVVNFNEHVTLGLPGPVYFTNRLDELESAISKTPTTGQTALYDAVAAAMARLQTGAHEKKVLIVISDGGDNASRLSLRDLLLRAGQSTALIYTVGIFDEADPDRNPRVLRRLARTTGGDAFFPGPLNGVVPVCERIARDIRNQYTIGYVPASAPPPGAFRAIRVVAGGDRKLLVRARSGYIAAGETSPLKDDGPK